MKDGIKSELASLLKGYRKRAGTDRNGSVRDLLTEIRHYCDRHELDFGKVDKGAYEVYTEELSVSRDKRK